MQAFVNCLTCLTHLFDLQIDSNKYYEAMGKPGQRGGEREAQLVKFSSNSLKAAQVCKLALSV